MPCTSDCCSSSQPGPHTTARYRKVLWAALAINFGMFIIEIVMSARSGSVSLMSDSLDFLGDAGNYLISLLVLSMALQATKRTEKVLDDMSHVAREGIVSFPNFGHWFHVWSILRGRMPITREMPYEWFDTPNLHLTTPHDFEDLAERLGLVIMERIFLAEGRPVRWFPVKRATQAIYRFRRRGD